MKREDTRPHHRVRGLSVSNVRKVQNTQGQRTPRYVCVYSFPLSFLHVLSSFVFNASHNIVVTEILQKNGLPVSGKKEELIDRLVKHDESKALESLDDLAGLEEFEESKLDLE